MSTSAVVFIECPHLHNAIRDGVMAWSPQVLDQALPREARHLDNRFLQSSTTARVPADTKTPVDETPLNAPMQWNDIPANTPAYSRDHTGTPHVPRSPLHPSFSCKCHACSDNDDVTIRRTPRQRSRSAERTFTTTSESCDANSVRILASGEMGTVYANLGEPVQQRLDNVTVVDRAEASDHESAASVIDNRDSPRHGCQSKILYDLCSDCGRKRGRPGCRNYGSYFEEKETSSTDSTRLQKSFKCKEDSIKCSLEVESCHPDYHSWVLGCAEGCRGVSTMGLYSVDKNAACGGVRDMFMRRERQGSDWTTGGLDTGSTCICRVLHKGGIPRPSGPVHEEKLDSNLTVGSFPNERKHPNIHHREHGVKQNPNHHDCCMWSMSQHIGLVAEDKTQHEILMALQSYKEERNVTKLAEVAREKGIPDNLRSIVWPILLKHHPCASVKSTRNEKLSPSQAQIPHDRIPRDIKRQRRRLQNKVDTGTQSPTSKPSPEDRDTGQDLLTVLDQDALYELTLESAVRDAITSFLSKNPDIIYEPHMGYVCISLADWLLPLGALSPAQQCGLQCRSEFENDSDKPGNVLITCFEQLMGVMLWPPPDATTSPGDLSAEVAIQRISQFLTALRKLSPELVRYLEEEDVVSLGEEWLWGWVKWWCAKELGKVEKGRLWDWYLGCQPTQCDKMNGDTQDSEASMTDKFYPCDWHMFICIALLKSRKDKLEELEQSEIRALLSRLPQIEMSLVIEEAKFLQRKLTDLKRQEEEEYVNSSSRAD